MRCYNGCPDSQLKAIWDANDKARADLKAAGLRATYFPLEGKWMVSTSIWSGEPFREVTGFHDSLVSAAYAALKGEHHVHSS